jgi:hypothetical protein
LGSLVRRAVWKLLHLKVKGTWFATKREAGRSGCGGTHKISDDNNNNMGRNPKERYRMLQSE